MSFTITRVELHHAIKTDYDNLHGFMAAQSFQRYYDVDGTRYYLPEAEYIRWGGTGKSDLALAETAAAKTGRTASIISTESASFGQSGLLTKKVS